MAYTVTNILAELTAHGFEDIDAAQLLYFINDAYYEFCSAPYPFLERTVASTLTAGNASIPIIDADSHTVSKILAISNDTQQYALEPTRLQRLTKNFSGQLTLPGAPVYYYEINDAWFHYPVNTAGDALTVRYLIMPKELGSTDTPVVPIAHRRVITNGALYRAYMMNDDVDIAQYFKKEVLDRTARIQEDLYSQQYDRPDYVVDTSDEYNYDDRYTY